MGNNKKSKEKETDIKDTIIGFIAPEEPEKTQEQEIIDFKLEKEKQKEKDDEKNAKRKLSYEEEEERLKKIKQELLQSLNVRIPAIEKRFKALELEQQKKKIKELEKQIQNERNFDNQAKRQESIEEKNVENEKERE